MLIIAHRGHKEHPENSRAAIYSASRHFDGIEFDVRASRDKKFFLLHDPLLFRTTSSWGRISRKHSAELRYCRLANGERLPSLESVLGGIRGYSGYVFLEIKSSGLEERLVRLIRKYHFKNMVITAFSMHSMKRYRELMPKVKLHYDSHFLTKSDIRKAKAIGAFSVGSPAWSLRESIVKEAKRNKLLVMPFKISSYRLLKKAKRLHVDGIFADNYY